MVDALQIALVFLAVCLAVFGLFIMWMAKTVKRDIERMLDEAESQSEKDEIRLRIVKALYPPRFNR
jgi:uncharacterized protein YoxC